MWEKWASEIIGGLVATIMVFFWNKQKGQDERIKQTFDVASDAHDRITKQGESNNDKFARRDDMAAMENRIIESMTNGFESLKQDIRDNKKGG